MRFLAFLLGLVAGTVFAAVPFKNGTRFALNDMPGELVVCTVGEAKSPIYPKNAVSRLLKAN